MALEAVLVSQGSRKDLDKALGSLDALYDPGDLGEFRLALDPLKLMEENISRSDLQRAVNEWDQDLLAQGIDPWPRQSRVAYLDWEAQEVRLLFQQPISTSSYYPQAIPIGGAVLAIGAALMKAATIALLVGLLVTGLKAVGVPVPSKIAKIADVMVIVGGLILAVRWLRALPGLRKYVSLPALVGGGLLILAFLLPDQTWKAFKWVAKQAGDIIEKLALPLGAAALVLGSALLITSSFGDRR